MKKNRINKLFDFLFPFIFIIGVILVVIGFNDYEIININYKEDNKINYKVYLKDNNFFEAKYLDENRTYISSLIDYLDIDYKYNIEYNEPFIGNYSYKYVAVVTANKDKSNDYYWQKEYDLTDIKQIPVNNESGFTINDNIKVSYSKYNEILNEFRRQYPIAKEGTLKIALKVVCDSNFKNLEEPIIKESELSLTLPLLEATVDVSINKSASNASNIYEFKERSKKISYLIYKISGIILILISIIKTIFMIKNTVVYKKNNKYEITLTKLLNNYDSIIVNVKEKPMISGFKIIPVSEFSELLDVYNEVRMPINYYQDIENSVSIFVIINDSIAWVYKLKKYDIIGGNNNEK